MSFPLFPGSVQGCLPHKAWVPPHQTDGYDGYTSFSINKWAYLSLEQRSWSHQDTPRGQAHASRTCPKFSGIHTEELWRASERGWTTRTAARMVPEDTDLRLQGKTKQGPFLGWMLFRKSEQLNCFPWSVLSCAEERAQRDLQLYCQPPLLSQTAERNADFG